MIVSDLVDRIKGGLLETQMTPYRSVPLIIDGIKAALINDVIPDLYDVSGFFYLKELYRYAGFGLNDTEDDNIQYILLSDIQDKIDDYEPNTMTLFDDSVELWNVDTMYNSYGGGGFEQDEANPPPTPTSTPPYDNSYYVKKRKFTSQYFYHYYDLGFYPEVIGGTVKGDRIELHHPQEDYVFAEFILLPDFSDMDSTTDIDFLSREICSGLIVPAVCGRLARADGGNAISANYRGEYNSKKTRLMERAGKQQEVVERIPQYRNRSFYKL